MRPGRVVALVAGCLFVLPGLALLVGGIAVLVASAVARDDDGFFEATLDRLETETVAVTTEDVDFAADPDAPDWVIDSLDVDVRLRVTNADSSRDIFVGIGRDRDVDQYLDGVARDEVIDVHDGDEPEYRRRRGDDDVGPPGEQTFWEASAEGPGTQEVLWEATSGRWSVVVMNADGSPGVAADADVGVKSGFVVPLGVILLAVGAVLTAGSVVLIVAGASGPRGAAAPPAPAGEVTGAVMPVEGVASVSTPVVLNAWLDPGLSNWQWLVKWFLAIPHFIVLAFLWIAFFVLTVVAGFAILFTGKYPRGIFDFNVGVLRWSWRVTYYATIGGIGTDRYPPFSLGPEPDYPATLDVAYPGELSRGLVLVKWWLLAIPHYLIVGILLGTGVGWTDSDRADGNLSLLGLLVVIAGVILLFRKRYPGSLFDLIIGLNRWVYRVAVYATLMTDRYPPFRLDQGGTDPAARETAESPESPESPGPPVAP